MIVNLPTRPLFLSELRRGGQIARCRQATRVLGTDAYLLRLSGLPPNSLLVSRNPCSCRTNSLFLAAASGRAEAWEHRQTADFPPTDSRRKPQSPCYFPCWQGKWPRDRFVLDWPGYQPTVSDWLGSGALTEESAFAASLGSGNVRRTWASRHQPPSAGCLATMGSPVPRAGGTRGCRQRWCGLLRAKTG